MRIITTEISLKNFQLKVLWKLGLHYNILFQDEKFWEDFWKGKLLILGNWRVYLLGIVFCLFGWEGCSGVNWSQAQQTSPVQLGLAAQYAGDQGILNNPNVVFFTGFELPNWQNEWSHVSGTLNTVSNDAQLKFVPLQGKALRTRLPVGQKLAMNMTYKFKEKTGSEPEEMYFRYYLRLGDDWNQTVDAGKLPGFSGTYGVAGWGGRRVNGSNGWSARGLWKLTIPSDDKNLNTTPIGTYVYHANQTRNHGEHWLWNKSNRGFLTKNRWYSLEQYLKLNTPGKNDGILLAWVDGQLAFEKTDIRFRDVSRLKIEQVWMNIYHGGSLPSPYDQHVYIDNLVIARKYIGPLNPSNLPRDLETVPPAPISTLRVE